MFVSFSGTSHHRPPHQPFTDLLRQLRIWPAAILFSVLVVGFKVVEAR